MIIQRKPPKYPRRGPSCLLVLFVLVGLGVSFFVIQNAEDVRGVIIPTPTLEPTRSATEYAVLAELSKEDGQFQEAIDYFEQAIALDGTRPEFYIRLIDLLVAQRQAELAVEKSEQATILAPENDAVWTSAAAAYIANGYRLQDAGDPAGANLEFAKATEAAREAVGLNPQNADAYAYAAGGLVLQGDANRYAEAEELADTAIFLEPDNPVARLYMGIVFTLQGFYAAALEQYQLGLEADPTNPELHYELAYNYFADGRVSDAILSFKDAIDYDPDNAAAYDGLAYMYLQLGEDPIAQEFALQSVQLNPNVARAQGRLGESYFRQSNYLSAIPPLERAVGLYGEVTPENAYFFNMLGNAYIRNDLNDCNKAIPLFQQVLEKAINPLIIESATAGIDECRRANLGQTP